MKIHKLSDMTRGWFIGNFEPSVYKTNQFEVGVLFFPKGEKKPPHYHKFGTEYNVLLEGTFTTNDVTLVPGDIFIIEPNVIVDPVFHEDCRILCVKIPSVTEDKYEVFSN